MGLDGHGIPSGINVTLRGIPERPWDPFWDRCDLPWDSFWERTDRGLNGHGILSRIAVTFRMVPSGNERTWDRTDVGSLLGSNGPFVSTYF